MASLNHSLNIDSKLSALTLSESSRSSTAASKKSLAKPDSSSKVRKKGNNWIKDTPGQRILPPSICYELAVVFENGLEHLAVLDAISSDVKKKSNNKQSSVSSGSH